MSWRTITNVSTRILAPLLLRRSLGRPLGVYVKQIKLCNELFSPALVLLITLVIARLIEMKRYIYISAIMSKPWID